MQERISLRENWDPLKKHEEKFKTRIEISIGNIDIKIYKNRPK